MKLLAFLFLVLYTLNYHKKTKVYYVSISGNDECGEAW